MFHISGHHPSPCFYLFKTCLGVSLFLPVDYYLPLFSPFLIPVLWVSPTSPRRLWNPGRPGPPTPLEWFESRSPHRNTIPTTSVWKGVVEVPLTPGHTYVLRSRRGPLESCVGPTSPRSGPKRTKNVHSNGLETWTIEQKIFTLSPQMECVTTINTSSLYITILPWTERSHDTLTPGTVVRQTFAVFLSNRVVSLFPNPQREIEKFLTRFSVVNW